MQRVASQLAAQFLFSVPPPWGRICYCGYDYDSISVFSTSSSTSLETWRVFSHNHFLTIASQIHPQSTINGPESPFINSSKIQIKLFSVNSIKVVLYTQPALPHFLTIAAQIHPPSQTQAQFAELENSLKAQIKLFSLNSTTFFVCTSISTSGDFQDCLLLHLLQHHPH